MFAAGDMVTWSDGSMLGEIVRVIAEGNVPWKAPHTVIPGQPEPAPVVARDHESYVIFGGPVLGDGTVLTQSLHWPEVSGLEAVDGRA